MKKINSLWIKVEDELPEDKISVLFCTSDVNDPAMIPLQGYYNNETNEWVGYLWSQKRTDVTHWQHLPQPPIQEPLDQFENWED